MRTSPKVLGQIGEQRAGRWYQQHGFTVAATNWHCREGELDLVVVRGSLVVFCEVKSRSSTRWGPPAAAVTPAKQRKLRLAAQRWLAENRWFDTVRFDVAEVVGTKVDVIENAF